MGERQLEASARSEKPSRCSAWTNEKPNRFQAAVTSSLISGPFFIAINPRIDLAALEEDTHERSAAGIIVRGHDQHNGEKSKNLSCVIVRQYYQFYEGGHMSAAGRVVIGST